MVGQLNFFHLGHVHLLEGQHLIRWSNLLLVLDEPSKSVELWGVGDGFGLDLELLTVSGVLHLVLVLLGLNLESLGVVLKTLNFLLFESDLEHLGGFLEVGGTGGGDSGDSGKLVHLLKSIF